MSKRVDRRYQSGRTPNWTKVTCRNRETFYAIGIANKGGKFDGLYLARRDGDELLYAGKVENGFSDQLVRDLKERLDPNRARINRCQGRSRSRRRFGTSPRCWSMSSIARRRVRASCGIHRGRVCARICNARRYRFVPRCPLYPRKQTLMRTIGMSD